MSITMQRVSVESKEGKAFLRRVIRENESLSYSDTWAVDARESGDWCLRFYRTARGGIGEIDRDIEVQTDFRLGVPRDSECGEVQSFSDSKVVYVPRPDRMWLHGSCVSTLADHVCKGGTVRIEASAGSTSSSAHGLAFLSLDLVMRHKGGRVSTVTLGQTVFVNGRVVCSGPCDVR